MQKVTHVVTGKYSSLSASEKIVAEYILKNPDEIILLSMRALAERVGLSDNTVLRFCRTCGFSGYLDFKSALIPQIVVQRRSIYEQVDEQDQFSQQKESIAKNISASIGETYSALVEDEVNLAAQKIALSSHTYVVGLAASHGISCVFTDSLHLMSISSSSHSDRVRIERTCLSLHEGSVLIGLTHSGETGEVLTAIQRAKERNVFTILISNNIAVKQSVESDIYLFTQVPAESIAGSYFALPRIAQLALIEVILCKIPHFIERR